MKRDFDASDEKLSDLLKTARPLGELTPGFQNRVWQRIEKLERKPESMLDLLASWLLTSRIAACAIAAVILLAATLGAVHGMNAGSAEAKSRYLSSVDPSYLPR
jgi:hypothetical protein